MSDLINNFAYSWAIQFSQIILQNTLFLGLIFLLLYLFRNASAQFKYNIGLIGILKLLVPPFIPLQWSISTQSVTASFPIDLILTDAAASRNIMTSEAANYSALDIYGILFLIWATVILIYVSFTFFSTLRLSLMLKNSSSIDQDELDHLRFSSQIKILKSARISMPITHGIFPKKIYVPNSWDLWSDECKWMVLQHELAHIRRYDNFTRLLQIIVQALYFFHPLVLLLNRQMREFSEMACDDLSVEPNHNSRLRYSKYLVEIAETVVKNPLACESVSAFIKHKNGLLRRVKYQIKESNMFKLSKAKSRSILITLVLFSLPFSFYLSADEPAVLSKSDSTNIIDVKLIGNNEISINGILTTLLKFKETMLKQITTDINNIAVSISAEKGVTMDQLTKLHIELRQMDLLKVGYVKSAGTDLQLMLPAPGNEKIMKEIPKNNIVNVLITKSGKVLVDNITFNISDVEAIIKKHLSENDKKIVSVQGEHEATVENFIAVLEQAKQGGSKRLLVNVSKN